MQKSFSYILLLILTIPNLAQDHKNQHKSNKHRFNDAERWSKIFEDPKRDTWQKPDYVIHSMNIEPNDKIADIGSATGYFPVRFAKTAHKGNVFGIDVEKDMVDYLNHRAQQEEIYNLSSILGDFDDPKIPFPVDIIFLCDTYHHIENRIEYFNNIRKDLKPNGELVIVDFRKGELPVGPPDKHKIAPEEVINELKNAGYELKKHLEDLPYQYILIFTLGDS